ncbi:MAG: DNA repair photolyase [Alphaproteobacteria bacterium]|nr:DNA repair photolyase [Alphaproteobacteria bacterium]
MIISASYKTDVPALYGDWFRARRIAGSCQARNVWDGKMFQVSLRDADCSDFVFGTRNARPFEAELARTGHTRPFVVQYTVTGHPRALERSVVPPDTAIGDIRRISRQFGERAVVWRYDPVVLTDATPAAWHIENTGHLASELAGTVDEVVVSFAQIYRKTRRNLDRAQQETGNAWRDSSGDEKRDLLARLGDITKAQSLSLTVCAQPELAGDRLQPARCIDTERLNHVARDLGHAPVTARTKGARPGCLCAESRDIGAYETCSHGCVYCYAVANPDRAKAAHREHDFNAPGLAGARMQESIDA